MDLRRTDIKQQNKNVNRLTFVFEHVNKYTMETRSKTNGNNGITCRGTHQLKKVKELLFIEHFLFYLYNLLCI